MYRSLPNIPFDLIIGRDTIKDFNLGALLPSHFFSEDVAPVILSLHTTHPLLLEHIPLHVPVSSEKDNSRQAQCDTSALGCNTELCGCQVISGSQPEYDSFNQDGLISATTFSGTHTWWQGEEKSSSLKRCYWPEPSALNQTQRTFVAALAEQNDHLFATILPDGDDIDDDKIDAFAPFLKVDEPVRRNEFFPNNDLLSAIQIEGDSNLTDLLVPLISRYSHLFSNTLNKEPADTPPFDWNVDTEKWKQPKNRGPPRIQSAAKQAEISRQLDLLLEQGVIERSNASYYSQVLLTPKPPNGYRMCIDYRNTNECTAPASWPLPNIKQMFTRLGTHKSSVYGVMDLTSGYHQAPLSLASRIFTAFIVFCGIFHYLRLPFGPKRAPSYFQEMMAAVVLVGLVYFICEIYLDDCIVHASCNAEFLTRLEQVFKRFDKHELLLKPGKCCFGLSKVEFCGRVVSREGISMSDKKISQVLSFPLPVYYKQLKSFLGLANYFRPHVRNHSEVARPLHGMLENYARGKVLKWTPAFEASFKELQGLISDCPTMHFVDPDEDLTLHTDASNYGIGGYLFQVIDGVELPVAFVSKSLSEAQLRWATIQKEAYGIFYSCKELDPLLRDRHFTLGTDHKNLLYIKESSNPMIVRWYMAIQELDYTQMYIKGTNNPIADGFSRLCANRMVEFPKEYTADDIFVSAMLTDLVIPNDKHQLIKTVHNSLVGHHGVDRTIKKLLQAHPSWPYLRQHVKLFVKQCPLCQKLSQMKLQIHSHPFTTSRLTPMETINIDYVGPYPDGGYTLVIIDCFSRWVELFAIDQANGENSAVALLEHFGRFGAPSQVKSDRGSHFVNSVIREFLLLIGTEHCLTLAYSKEENALVERANKEVNRHLRAFTFDSNTVDSWRLALPMVQRIMNTSFSDRTKLAPSQLLFGNALDLDRGIILPSRESVQGNQPLSEYMDKLVSLQEKLILIARKNIVFTDAIHMGEYKPQRTDYRPDSYVLVKYREGSAPTRLHTPWKGPLRVISGKKSKFILFDLITNKEKEYHVTDMKPFHFDPLLTNPIDVARKDHLEFFVESILQHKGSKGSKRTQFHFLIKWAGYDDDKNTWEPYANIRDMKICHEYLQAHNLAYLIPKKFRT